MKVLCIVAPSKDGISKLYKINKSLEELKTLSSKHPLNWIVKGLEDKISPNSFKMEPCSFHSNYDSKIPKDDLDFCYKHASHCGNTKYAIYDENYICYDLCNHQEEINNRNQKESEMKYRKILSELDDFYNENIDNFIYFKKVYDEREELFSEKKKLENPQNTKIIKNPKFDSLNQILITCEVRYNEACESKEKIYKSNKFIQDKFSLKDYIAQETKTEKDKLEEARGVLNGWLSRNGYLNQGSSKYKLEDLDDLIIKISKRLYDNYNKSYKDILLLHRELEHILHYCKTHNSFNIYVQKVQKYINFCNENLNIFDEFKGNIKHEDVLKIIDFYTELDRKKIEEAKKEEKLYKEKISKVSLASNSVIVKADGTVVEDNSVGPKIIVGKVLESKADIEAEKQVRIARNTTWL
jgi:hypothetical protein